MKTRIPKSETRNRDRKRAPPPKCFHRGPKADDKVVNSQLPRLVNLEPHPCWGSLPCLRVLVRDGICCEDRQPGVMERP